MKEEDSFKETANYMGLLKKLRICVEGDQAPRIATNFTGLRRRYKKVRLYLLRNMARMGVRRPTPVQMATCPAIL
jgi:hypothetical protein